DTTLLPRFTLTLYFLYSLIRPPPTSTLFPYTTLFRSTHARHRDQPEQIMVGPSAQPVFRRQSQRRRQQHIDLRVAVDIGLGTLQSRQDAGGWHLRLRLDVRDMAREAPHVSQPQRPGRTPIGRQRRPLHRQLRSDGRGLALLHEGDEVGEPSCLMV